MSKLAKIEIEATEELTRLKGVIKQYDDGFHRAYRSQMGYAFLAGVALNRAKDILPHGEFLPWVEAEVGVARMSASRYRKFADALIAEHPAVGKCNPCYILTSGEIPAAELTPEETEKVCAAVHKIANGKTLTEMYRDLGVIRQPEKPKHHPRKETTIAQEMQSKQEQDIDLLESWRGPLAVWRDAVDANDAQSPEYNKAVWQMVLDEAVKTSDLARRMLKGAA